MTIKRPAVFLWGGICLSVLLSALYAFSLSKDPEPFAMFGISALFLYFFSFPILLLAAKSQQSTREVQRRVELLSWPLPGEPDETPRRRRLLLRLALLLAAVLLLFSLLLLSGIMSVLSAVVLCVSALLLFGGALVWFWQRAYLLYGGNRFTLFHNALYLAGTMVRLDGRTNAVYEVALNDKDRLLRLGVIQKGNSNYLQIPVPEDQVENVNSFIADLESHFEKRRAAARQEGADEQHF